jgi:ATP-binding cassette subfamily F protein 3
VLLITHDPHLVELVADRLWLVDGGTVAPFEGDMDDYRVLLAKKNKPVRTESSGLSRKDERRMRAEERAKKVA